LLPADPEKDNFSHLEEALEVSADSEYRERRRRLYEWHQRFVRSDVTDAPSIKRAVADVHALVAI
jgi:hypothetical protein